MQSDHGIEVTVLFRKHASKCLNPPSSQWLEFQCWRYIQNLRKMEKVLIRPLGILTPLRERSPLKLFYQAAIAKARHD